MGRRQRRRTPSKNNGPAAVTESIGATRAAGSAAGRRAPIAVSRRRLWCYRAALAVLAPAIFLLLCEAGLRLVGYGNPTAFFLPGTIGDRDVYVPNNRFAWRFFGPTFARQPMAFAIEREKPARTVRVFVFGESAAFGDPQPEFGMPRMLQALLELRMPDVKFEVVNLAMTGINSHTVVSIARDAVPRDGDVWVIFMGNNEVVGPFGAGTVFGPQAPSTAIIRSSLALQKSRVGQSLAAVQRMIHKPPADKSQWGGMLMFVENQVRHDDPRMTTVYRHFDRNLNEILDLAASGGARVVVSTVAVNLRDCAPLASLHRPGLPEHTTKTWQETFRRGQAAQLAGNHTEALQLFDDAEQLDGDFAELHFAAGHSLLALGKDAEATKRLERARDLDVLRFRCDSRLNDITRAVAAERRPEHVVLVDAERLFADHAGGAPGADAFYEHVHLTYEGNYLLARAIAEQVVQQLPAWAEPEHDSTMSWPTPDDCARRLAWTDWHRLRAVSEILGRLSDPPFTSQSNQAEQVERLLRQADDLQPRAAQSLRDVRSTFSDAIRAAPDDPILFAQFGVMLGMAGDSEAAVAAARRSTELLPTRAENWMLLGAALATQQRFDEAVDAFQEAFRHDDQNVWALLHLGRVYAKLGQRSDAMQQFQRAIALNPRFGPAYLDLGQLLERTGKLNEADQNYRLALENRVYRADELSALAKFCKERGWLAEAATNFLDAVRLSPGDPRLRLNAGRCLAELGQHADAIQQFEAAVRLAPQVGEARFLLAVELGRENRLAESTAQFREAVRLLPGLPEARLNLGIALSKEGRRDEALEQFRAVLQLSPQNPTALDYVRRLESEPQTQ